MDDEHEVVGQCARCKSTGPISKLSKLCVMCWNAKHERGHIMQGPCWCLQSHDLFDRVQQS